MVDELRKTLLERAFSGPENFTGPNTKPTQQKPPEYAATSQTPTAPTGLPAPTPADPKALPPAWQRYLTAQKMQQAYANNWNPNPILLRILEGNR